MKYLLGFLIIIILPARALSSTAYVHSIKANLYKSPTMKSKVVTGLTKGDKLKITRTKGVWYRVKASGHTGWIYSFMVKNKPVKDTTALYSKLKSFFYKIDSISKKSRRRPSSYTSTAAARGLREKRRNFARKYNSDYKSLEKIESITISDQEAMEFLWKGVANE